MAKRIILEFQAVTKVYQTGDLSYTALHEIDLSVAEGEVIVMMGPSGAGKTTFLTIAGALMKPTEGRVSISGVDITELDEGRLPKVRQEKIGFIFQSFNLLEALTARENVQLVMATRGITGKAARVRAGELLELFGVGDRLDYIPAELSGGQKQRVAIARALANNPDLLLADEPTANLDARRGREIMEILRMTAKELGKAVVAVSHDLRIRELSDRVLWLEDARESGTVHATEIRWLKFDAIEGTIDVYFVDFPDSWQQTAKDLADRQYAADANWKMVLDAYQSNGWISTLCLVDGLEGVTVRTDADNALDSRHVGYELNFWTSNGSLSTQVSATVRLHRPPVS